MPTWAYYEVIVVSIVENIYAFAGATLQIKFTALSTTSPTVER